MLKFNRQINYEPSNPILRFWLFTRKNKYQLQLVNLPGLFQTRNYTLDTLGFVLIEIFRQETPEEEYLQLIKKLVNTV